MVDTLSIDMVDMQTLFHDRLRIDRMGVRLVEASVASRNEANTHALRAGDACAHATTNHPHRSPSESTQILGRAHSSGVARPQVPDQQTTKVYGVLLCREPLQSHGIADEPF